MDEQENLAHLNDRLQAQHHELAQASTRAGEELSKAKGQLDQFAQPPLTCAAMLRLDRCSTDSQGVQHACAEVWHGNRRVVLPVAPTVNAARLETGERRAAVRSARQWQDTDGEGRGALAGAGRGRQRRVPFGQRPGTAQQIRG